MEHYLRLGYIPASYLICLVRSLSWYNLPRQTQNLILQSAALYLGGAIGFELFTAFLVWNVSGLHPIMVVLTIAIEELLEMLGILTFIRALLLYIGANFPAVRIHFAEKN